MLLKELMLDLRLEATRVVDEKSCNDLSNVLINQAVGPPTYLNHNDCQKDSYIGLSMPPTISTMVTARAGKTLG